MEEWPIENKARLRRKAFAPINESHDMRTDEEDDENGARTEPHMRVMSPSTPLALFVSGWKV